MKRLRLKIGGRGCLSAAFVLAMALSLVISAPYSAFAQISVSQTGLDGGHGGSGGQGGSGGHGGGGGGGKAGNDWDADSGSGGSATNGTGGSGGATNSANAAGGTGQTGGSGAASAAGVAGSNAGGGAAGAAGASGTGGPGGAGGSGGTPNGALGQQGADADAANSGSGATNGGNGISQSANVQSANTTQTVTEISLEGGAGGSGNAGGAGGDGGNAGGRGGNGNNGSGGTGAGSGNAGGRGGHGGTGADGGNGGIGQTVDRTMENVISVSTVTNASNLTGGAGGNAGAGGNGGNAGASISGSNIGGTGALGGKGGNAAVGGDVNLVIKPVNQITFEDSFTLTGGRGGNGAKGGNGGNDVSSVNGGNGGAAGLAAKGGNIHLDIRTETAIMNNQFTITGGAGGNGGANSVTGFGTLGGTSSAGAAGGDIWVEGNTIALLNDLLIETGVGGTSLGTVNSGKGGDIRIDLQRNLEVLENNSITFTKSDRNDSAAESTMNINVLGALHIAEGKTAVLVFDQGEAFDANDKIHFRFINLERGSTLDATTGIVAKEGTTMGTGPGVNYLVTHLNVHTDSTWITGGSFALNSNDGIHGNRTFFNMTDIDPGHTMLSFQGAGHLDVTNYNPLIQHQEWLADPAHNDTAAVITSEYQLKRLDLDHITLATHTNGLSGHFDTDPARDNYFKDQIDPNDDNLRVINYDAGLRRYYWDMYVDTANPGNALMAHNAYTADGYKTYLQGALSAAITQNQTFNRVSNPMMSQAAASAPDTTVVNTLASGFSTETDTGSHVDVDGISAGISIARKIGHQSGGATTVGAFFEFGYGSYDTFASVYALGELRGSGDTQHYGGGLFLINQFSQGTYLEASVRGGGVDNEFNLKADSRFNIPYSHNYDTSSTYYGAHVGLGHKFDLTEQAWLDLSGKFFWTRTSDDSFITEFGEYVTVDDIDSMRTRLGATLGVNNEAKTFGGYFTAAWEHEFDGEATGTVGSPVIGGWDDIVDPPKLRGSSGFGELGLTFNPANSGYSFGASAYGLIGTQKGFGGTLSLKFEF